MSKTVASDDRIDIKELSRQVEEARHSVGAIQLMTNRLLLQLLIELRLQNDVPTRQGNTAEP